VTDLTTLWRSPRARVVVSAADPAATAAAAAQCAPGTDRRRRWVGTWRLRYGASLAVADAVAITTAGFVAHAGRVPGKGWALLPLVWVLDLGLGGAYRRTNLGTGSQEYRSIIHAVMFLLACLAIATALFSVGVDRTFVRVVLPLATTLALVNHRLARRWLHGRRATGRCVDRVIVIGKEQMVVDLVRHLRRSTSSGLSLVGVCTDGDGDQLMVDGEPLPVLGQPTDALRALASARADAVAITDGHALGNDGLRRFASQLGQMGIDLLVAPAVTDVDGPRMIVARPAGGLPLLHVAQPKLVGSNRVLKDALERLLALLLLLVCFPALALVSLAVRLGSSGPALFKQVRVGRGGREFVLFKFRTMKATAEAERDGLAPSNMHDGLLFKIRNDPRCTTVGRFLRRFSIDELPQLWNVVKGDMSIVGPRPSLPSEVERYTGDVRRRLLVKPGLTGLWQVSGRCDLPWQEAVRLDLDYVENWSLALDLLILCRTPAAVLDGRGAY
jgi:exopolysaccharide biosynthesis polyprenyl glycosylphosphotransferase